MIDWKEVQNYPAHDATQETPLVLLWEKRAGVTVGRVYRFADGDIMTPTGTHHGFTFTHYAEINTPENEARTAGV